jgi:hypothetical protein
VIGLAAYKQNGKDEVCKILLKHLPGYVRLAFADPLREEVQAALDGSAPFPTDAPMELQRLLNEQIFENDERLARAEPPIHANDKPYSDRMRKILQMWGTEYRRAQDDRYWLKAWLSRAAMFHGAKGFVVTDCRFPNEEAFLHFGGGEVWRVDRFQPDGDPHPSERFIPVMTVDRVIDNTGTLEDLERRVLEVLRVGKNARRV